MRVEESIEIDKPVEEVFDYLFEIVGLPRLRGLLAFKPRRLLSV
jgi:uncharacterized membrane protein